MAKRNNPPTDYSCSLHCCAGGLISSVDVLYVVFFLWYISIRLFWRGHCVLGAGCILRETPLQRTLSLNCKDGWSKNEGWLFCFFTDESWSRGGDCCGQSHPGSPWNCILIFEVQFQYFTIYCLSVLLLLNVDLICTCVMSQACSAYV